MKKLIIVCEDKLHRYGDFLAQLISGIDDKDDNIIGIKDGMAAAQVWTEKEYNDNSLKMSSEQYILFIGNSKLIKAKRHHMQIRYSEFGMNYGWLGKQAVLFVDQALSFTEYEAFYNLATANYAEGSHLNAVRLLPSKGETTISPNSEGEEVEIVGDYEDGNNVLSSQYEKHGAKKLLIPFKIIGDAVKKTADAGMDTLNKVSNDLSVAAKGKEIEDQQYTCLTLRFYLHDLATFLGLKEA